ncbi:MAG: S10 family peptidase [Pirellulales bacterium]
MMKHRPAAWLLVLLVGVACGLPAFAPPAFAADAKAANEKKEDKSKGDDKKDADKKDDVDKIVTTEHVATIQGQEIKYTVTAGKLAMKNDVGKTKAHIFFIAYTKNGVEDLGQRPISFAFNGGPGSSSVWLHLGMLGPKRIKLPDDASSLAPPYELVNNPHSLLDITDLVFIDPVSTGFSRPADGEDKGQFHGYQQDIESVAQFIHEYLSKYGRWRSPKFLIGESYGGLRAAGLSGYLLERYNIALNGIVMISPAINFSTIAFGAGDLPYITFLPSYTATAWYHKALPGDLQALALKDVYQQAVDFANNEYALALMKGEALSDAERSAVAEKLARFTGLSKDYVEGAKLRVPMWRYGKELLRKKSRTVGRYDSRYTGIDADDVGENTEYDPSQAAIFGPFTATINDYLRNQLKFEDDRVYEILTEAVQPWKYDRFGARSPDASDTLRQAMAEVPFLKLFIAEGYYDLATPPQSVEYSVNHMLLPAERRGNVTTKLYEGGHMMYVFEPSMEKLRRDLEAFYKDALSGKPKSSGDES